MPAVDRTVIDDVTSGFDDLGEKISKLFLKPGLKGTPAQAACNHALTKLQEAHQWLMSGFQYLANAEEIHEDIAEKALRNNAIQGLPKDNVVPLRDAE